MKFVVDYKCGSHKNCNEVVVKGNVKQDLPIDSQRKLDTYLKNYGSVLERSSKRGKYGS